MSDRYLWDRSGKPDPEVERLEKLLAPFALEPQRQANVRGRDWRWLAVAAAVIVIAGAALWAWRRDAVRAEKTSWQAVRLTDGQAGSTSAVFTGQKIATDAQSRVELRSDSVGQVQLEPGSELVVRESSARRQLLSLRRGRLHALIWAPPSHFAVDTPGVRAVDLGCAYTLETKSNGDGLITVQSGWVAFDHKRQESFIPAGAACRVSGKRGPGVPWFDDAPESLRGALRDWEAGSGDAALRAVLSSARSRDAITLWHLLSRVRGAERAAVFDRFAQLTKVAAVDRQAVLSGDRRALDLCWNALELGDTSWWRTWKQVW
jgi:hypothetical protein